MIKLILFILLINFPIFANIQITGGTVASGGSDTQVQFNDSGVLNGDSGFVFDKATGFVGIGATPNSFLQFSNALTNRKITLFQNVNNEHQYFGFGINGNAIRYQVAATTSLHVFFAGTGSSSSVELMRVQGDGKVGIGQTLPNTKLDIGETSGNFGGGISSSVATSVVGFYYATSTASQSCDTTCPAEDENAGFGANSGVCQHAWDGGAAISTCATAATDQKCFCLGSK